MEFVLQANMSRTKLSPLWYCKVRKRRQKSKTILLALMNEDASCTNEYTIIVEQLCSVTFSISVPILGRLTSIPLDQGRSLSIQVLGR